MTSSQLQFSKPATRDPGWHEIPARIAGAFQRFMRSWRQARRDRLAVDTLLALDDQQLKDIGLNRWDIKEIQ